MNTCRFKGKCKIYDKHGWTCNRTSGKYGTKPAGCYDRMAKALLPLFVFMLLLLPGARAAIPNNLIGYWQMDSGSSTVEPNMGKAAPNQNLSMIYATYSTSVKKLGSGSYYFDGASSQMNTTANTTLGNNWGNITIEAWFNATVLPTSGNQNSLISKTGTTGVWLFGLTTNATGTWCKVDVRHDATGWCGTIDGFVGGSSITTNSWNWCGATWSGQTDVLSLYASTSTGNAVLIASKACSGTVTSTGTHMVSVGYNQEATNQNFTGYIDEVRVWYDLLNLTQLNASRFAEYNDADTTPPGISWNTPATNNTNTSNANWIYWNATVSEAPNYCILNINNSANYTMAISGSYCTYNLTGLTNQTVQKAIVYANDSSGNSNRTIGQWWATVYLSGTPDTINPTVTLVTPANSNVTSQTGAYTMQEFNCTATDNINLSNATLWGNWSGGWHANATQPMNGVYSHAIFDVNQTSGTYKWNCRVCDNSSNCAWGAANFTFTISDITKPIWRWQGSNSSSITTNQSIQLYAQGLDVTGLHSGILSYNSSGGGSTTLPHNTTGLDWIKYVNNPVIYPNWSGSSLDVSILLNESTNVYHAWFSALNSSMQSIGYANSTDGITWNVAKNMVIKEGSAGAWDAGGSVSGNEAPDCLYVNTTGTGLEADCGQNIHAVCTYTGTSATEKEAVGIACADREDMEMTKYSGNSCGDFGLTGPGCIVNPQGTDTYFYSQSFVKWNDTTWRIYGSIRTGAGDGWVAYVDSTNLINWSNYTTEVLPRSASGREEDVAILKNANGSLAVVEGQYWIYYVQVEASPVTTLWSANSTNGTYFTKLHPELYSTAGPDDYQARNYIYSPYPMTWNDSVFRLWYSFTNEPYTSGQEAFADLARAAGTIWTNTSTYLNTANTWTYSNFTLNGASLGVGSRAWRIYYNDTSGNYNATDVMPFQVVYGGTPDTTPPSITWNYPNNNTATSNVTYIDTNVTLDEVVVNCTLFDNGTYAKQMSYVGGGTNYCYANWGTLANQTTHCLQVNATDGYGNSNFSSSRCVTINLYYGAPGAYCGDASCNGGETCATCETDCGACCGDASCNYGETCSTCETDCGVCAGSCGYWEEYQETYNGTSINGTWSNYTYFLDGNWLTYALNTTDVIDVNLTFRYSKPSGAVGLRWKFGLYWNITYGTSIDMLYPVPEACWAYDPDNIYLRLFIRNNIPFWADVGYGAYCQSGDNSWECIPWYDTICYQNMQISGPDYLIRMVEEGVYWNMTNCTYSEDCGLYHIGSTNCGGWNMQMVLTCEDKGGGWYDWSDSETYCPDGCYQGACRSPIYTGVNVCSNTSETICDGSYVLNCTVGSDGFYGWNDTVKTYCKYGCYKGTCLNPSSDCSYGDQICSDGDSYNCTLNNNGVWAYTLRQDCTYGCEYYMTGDTILNTTCSAVGDAHGVSNTLTLGASSLAFIFEPIIFGFFMFIAIVIGIVVAVKAGSPEPGVWVFLLVITLGTVFGAVPWYAMALFAVLYLGFKAFGGFVHE